MEFLGHFKPPAVGTTVVPINIAGEGRCTVTEDGLGVTGFRSTSQGPLILLALGALAAGAYFLQIRFDLPDELFYLVGAVGLAVILRVLVVGGKAKKLGKPISLRIPWSSIKRAERDQHTENSVVVVVHKFKPKGGLYFSPHDGAEPFLDAIESHRPN